MPDRSRARATWWQAQVVPRLVDRALSSARAADLRREVCGRAVGTVLEIGFGSGRNLAHYPAAVREVLAVEPAELAWRRASRSVSEFGRPVRRIAPDAARLPLPDASVDCAVSTWTMCTIADLDAALGELVRVLRPGGAVHFVEHGLAPSRAVRRWQHLLQPVWGPVAGGCHLERDIPARLTAAGLRSDDLVTRYASWARPFSWFSVGTALPH